MSSATLDLDLDDLATAYADAFHTFDDFDAKRSYYRAHGRPLPGERSSSSSSSAAGAVNTKSKRSGTTKGPSSKTKAPEAETAAEHGSKSSTSDHDDSDEEGGEPARKRLRKDRPEEVLACIQEEWRAISSATAAPSISIGHVHDHDQHATSIQRVIFLLLDAWRVDCDRMQEEEQDRGTGLHQDRAIAGSSASTTAAAPAAAALAGTTMSAKLERSKLVEAALQLFPFSRLLKTATSSTSSLSLNASLLKQLAELCRHAEKAEYEVANQLYMDITIGQTKWHQDVAHGEARHNKGYNARKVKRDTGTEFMENKAVHGYILALKRLLTVLSQNFLHLKK
eukprot:g1036.t1